MMKKSQYRIASNIEFEDKIQKMKKFEPLKWDRVLCDWEDEATDIGDCTYTFVFKGGGKYKVTSYLSEGIKGERAIYKFVLGENVEIE